MLKTFCRIIQTVLTVVTLSVASEGLVAQPRIVQNRGQEEASRKIATIEDLYTLGDTRGARLDYTGFRRILKELDPDVRGTTLRRLILAPNVEVASAATLIAIAEHDGNLAETVASRVCSWDGLDQGAVLYRIGSVRGAFLDVARAVIARCASDPTPQEWNPNVPDPTGFAAILLAKSGVTSDRQLIVDAARAHQNSVWMWTAVGHAGITDPELMSYASRFYLNKTLPKPIRVAAATALQSVDQRAAEFAIGEVRSYLAQYAGTDVGMLAAAAFGPSKDQLSQEAFRGTLLSGGILVSLLDLNGKAAEDLAFHGLESRNQLIRRTCGQIAAYRWPVRFLKAGQGTYSTTDYAELLALLALHHPEFEAAARSQAPAGDLDSAIGRIRQDGGPFALFDPL